MVSKGQFVGLDWNRITRLHSQVKTGTHCCFIDFKTLKHKTQPTVFDLIAELSRARSAQRSTMGKKVW